MQTWCFVLTLWIGLLAYTGRHAIAAARFDSKTRDAVFLWTRAYRNQLHNVEGVESVEVRIAISVVSLFMISYGER